MSVSGIYAGVVTHTRRGPRRHRLRYRVFMLLPELDEVDERGARLPPNERVGVAIEAVDGEGVVLNAAFDARRRPLNDANLLAAWATHPLMSVGVLWAIHWEVLKMWLTGEPLQPRPPPPLQPVTLAVPTGR